MACSNEHACCSIWGCCVRCHIQALHLMLGGLLDAGPCFAPASPQLPGQTAAPVRLFLTRISVLQHRSCDGLDFRRSAGKLALVGLDRLKSRLCRFAAGLESCGTEQRCMLGVCIGASCSRASSWLTQMPGMLMLPHLQQAEVPQGLDTPEGRLVRRRCKAYSLLAVLPKASADLTLH